MEWDMYSFPATPECQKAIERERARLISETGGAAEISRSAAIRSAILRGAPRRPRPQLDEDDEVNG